MNSTQSECRERKARRKSKACTTSAFQRGSEFDAVGMPREEGGEEMNQPYFCPNCKTNRTRFNLIQQVSHSVKMDPATGEVMQAYDEQIPDPFHAPYRGPDYKVQCATCSLISEEEVFVKAAQNNPRGRI